MGGPVTGPSAQQSFLNAARAYPASQPHCVQQATLVDTCYIPVDSHPTRTPPLSTTFGPRQASLSTPCLNSTSLACEAASPPALLNLFLGRRPSNRDPRRTPLFLHQPSLLRPASLSTTLRSSTSLGSRARVYSWGGALLLGLRPSNLLKAARAYPSLQPHRV